MALRVFSSSRLFLWLASQSMDTGLATFRNDSYSCFCRLLNACRSMVLNRSAT